MISKAKTMPTLPDWLEGRFGAGCVFLVLTAFYAATIPANHTESVDGYWYALQASIGSISDIHDTRSILFHMINRLVFVLADSLGLGFKSFDVILGLIVLAASASAVLLARLLISGFGVPARAAWLGAGMLGFSYGFWRYSGEVEVYVPSICLILLCLNLLFHALATDRPNWKVLISAGACAGIAVLYYQPNVIPLFFAIPLLFIGPLRLLELFVYGFTGSAVVLMGLCGAFFLDQDHLPSAAALFAFVTARNSEFSPEPFTAMTLLRAASTFGYDLFVSNWIFASQMATDNLKRFMPSPFIEEFVFAARSFRPFSFAPLVIAPLVVATMVWLIWRAIQARDDWFFDRRVAYTMVWFAIHAAIAASLDPGIAEVWIIAVLPFAILASVYVFRPVLRNGGTLLPAAFVLLMGFYNFAGGIAMLQSSNGDLYHVKTAWLRENATASDIVWLNRDYNLQFAHYLRYVVGVDVVISTWERSMRLKHDVVPPDFGDLAHLLSKDRPPGSRLFVFGEFLNPNPALKTFRGSSKSFDHAVNMARQVAGHIRPVEHGPRGETYMVTVDTQRLSAILASSERP